MKTLDVKSNEGIIYSFLGWKPCNALIHQFENCKKMDNPGAKDPTLCYNEAKALQQCYSEKAMSVEPICLPIFNDAKECLFQGDSNIYSCKEELNELVYCNENPREYKDFLAASTPYQNKKKVYDFYKNSAKYDKYA